MSRPKVRTSEADRLIHEEAVRRIEYRSNKQLAQILIEKGIQLSPQYIGELVKAEARRIKAQRNYSTVRTFHGERSESGGSSGTIER